MIICAKCGEVEKTDPTSLPTYPTGQTTIRTTVQTAPSTTPTYYPNKQPNLCLQEKETQEAYLHKKLYLLQLHNHAVQAVHGCHCPGDMAVRMFKVLARPWVGVRVCHLLLLFFVLFCFVVVVFFMKMAAIFFSPISLTQSFSHFHPTLHQPHAKTLFS